MTSAATATMARSEAGARRARLESIDVVRGAIMILMALDHTRDFFGVPGQNPVDVNSTTAALFLTRWVTHFCAPVFFLLMGTGASLAGRRRSKSELSRFLLARGIWLIVLEVVVLRCLSYQFNADYRVTFLMVLWALGWALIVLAALTRLSPPVVAGLGVAMIAGHNLFDGVRSTNPLWVMLHAQGVVLDIPGHLVFVAYPLIPWVGVTAVGYALGQVYGWPADRRRALLLRLGLGLSIAFLLLRGLDGYGDPSGWMLRNSTLFSVLSFLNTTKYPPSLLFLMMTLGPALLLLRAVDGRTPTFLHPILAFGRVPLAYYVLHFALIHAFAVVVCYVRYGTAHWMFESPDLAHYPFTAPPGWGYSLPVVYIIWAIVVVVMYPFCRWFASVKARRSSPWLSYF
jgi:uncharacterized membrane protein